MEKKKLITFFYLKKKKKEVKKSNKLNLGLRGREMQLHNQDNIMF